MNEELKRSIFADKIRSVPCSNIRRSVIDDAAAVLRNGGVAVIPTTGLYGLGALAFNRSAVKKIFEIKDRPYRNPILLLISHKADVGRLAVRIPQAARLLMERFWPGRLTIVFEAASHVPDILRNGSPKIGIRQCAHPVARKLIESLGEPLTGTSANISGEFPCSRIADLNASIIQKADIILDSGELEGGKGSTVVDITTHPTTIIREGVISKTEIMRSVLN